MVVSDELRSLSSEDGVSSGTNDEPDAVVVVESGDGCELSLTGFGVGGMTIRDGGSIKLRAGRDEILKQGA